MWFGGIYQDPKNFFPSFSVAPNYFDVYTNLQLPPEQLKAFQDTRTGAVVGETLAKEFGCGESTVRDICTYRTRASA